MIQFSVSQAVMIESHRYDNMYLRPFQSHFNGAVGDAIFEATSGGNNLKPQALTEVSSMFLQPHTDVVGSANLVNGFAEKRLTFMIEVTEQSGLASGNRYILSGYTDYYGISHLTGQPSINPDMKLYFNNLFVLRDVMHDLGYGRTVSSNLAQNSHILHNPGANDYMANTETRWSMLPENVFTALDFNTNPMMTEFASGGCHDHRAVVSGARLADRRRDSRPNYLAQTIQNYMNASVQDTTWGDDTYDDGDVGADQTYNLARSSIQERPVSTNRLLSAFSVETSFRNTGYVTYQELCRILPDMDHHLKVLTGGAVQSMTNMQHTQPGQGEGWHSSTFEAVAASLLQQLLPGIMADHLLTNVSFVATNDTIGGQDVMTLGDFRGFTQHMDYTQYLQAFLDRVQRELLYDISKAGQMSYSIQVTVDLMYESVFEISLNGAPSTRFVAPSFCDSLYMPLLTNDANMLNVMADDVGNLLTTIQGDPQRMVGDRYAPPPNFTL